jgi:transposase
MKVEITKELLQEYLADGLSLEAIGERLGRNPSTISYHLKKHGLAPVNAGKHASRGPLERQVLSGLIDEGLSLREIGELVDRSPSTVRYWIGKFGLETRSMGLRHPELKEAKAKGEKHATSTCRHHGRTTFVMEGRGYYRCMKCRRERVSEWRRRSKRKLVQASGGACVRCGYDECHAALQFHHLIPADKEFAISRGGITRAFAELQSEAEKCVLLCANCHAEIEAGMAALEN